MTPLVVLLTVCAPCHPLLAYLLQKILGMVSSLTVILYLCLWNLIYPVNLLTFFGQLFPLINFDIIPEIIVTWLFQLENIDDDAYNEQFELVGFENQGLV